MSESITCPKCGRTSHHPLDVKFRYCGNCHQYHDLILRQFGLTESESKNYIAWINADDNEKRSREAGTVGWQSDLFSAFQKLRLDQYLPSGWKTMPPRESVHPAGKSGPSGSPGSPGTPHSPEGGHPDAGASR